MKKDNKNQKQEFEKNDYVLQENRKTKVGSAIIIVALVIIILGVVLSGVFFEWW